MIIIWLIIGLSVKNILRDDLWGLYNRIPVILVGIFYGFCFQEPVLIKLKPIFLAYCSENTREITAFLVKTLLGYCLFKCQDLLNHIF